ncbi:MAG: phosphatase PAP2-related protein [Candidatus Woesearchaeota archaeon]
MSKKDYFKNWKKEIYGHKYLIIISLLFLIFANIMNLYAGRYVDSADVTPVNDMILDNIPTINLEGIFSYGMMLFLAILLFYVLIFRVKKFHSAVFSFSTLILVRSIFITLTHLGKPVDAAIITGLPGAYQILNFHNDLFFSGHAALPFMAYLIFRKEKIGILFLITTILFSITVLLMHVHYSIDVFAAFFITYGIYKFCEWFSEKYF